MPTPIAKNFSAIALTLFCVVAVPNYWQYYGPAVFWSFCDVAVAIACVGFWLNSSFLLSISMIAMLMPGAFWTVDVASGVLTGYHSGATAYIFADEMPLILRLISTFHSWLPLLLLLRLRAVGYNRSAFKYWLVVTAVLLLISYFFLPQPGEQAAPLYNNINYAFGVSQTSPQGYLPESLWLITVFSVCTVFFWLPAHLVMAFLSRR